MIDRSPVTGTGGRVDPVAEILAAVRLLTRFQFGGTDAAADATASGAVAFPLVGALVGVIGAVPLVLIGPLEPLLASFLALALVAVVTGALHLDGLADTADALLAPDAVRAERARKDPSVGVGGVVALILVLGIEASALAGLATAAGGWLAGGALVLAAVVGRTVAVVVVVTERSRIAPDGFGAWFAARVRRARPSPRPCSRRRLVRRSPSWRRRRPSRSVGWPARPSGLSSLARSLRGAGGSTATPWARSSS